MHVRVAAGTLNQAKIRGIKKAFEAFLSQVEVTAVAVDSGVSKQPMSLEETFKGAMNRAFNASSRLACDYGVGVEAGVFHLAETPIGVQVAVVVDATGRFGVGLSPGFPLPPVISKALVSGSAAELEEAVDRLFGTRQAGEHEGLVGLLTGRKVTREDLTYHAVVTALIPFLNSRLWEL
ncbi:MAG: inosine/xanthosine triphosphatase [Thermofilaceae archaeon]|nr:inosine/xanthosine triphosphatase [Thermofilaceae archaeon]